MMQKLLALFKIDHTPRWITTGALLASTGAFLASTAVSLGTTFYLRHLDSLAQEAQTRQEKFERKVDRILSYSLDFQAYAGAFVSAVLDKSSEQSRSKSALLANILAQDAATEHAMHSLEPTARAAAEKYRDALRAMKATTEATSDIATMGDFWHAASDLLVRKNYLIEALEAQPNTSDL